MKNKIPITKQKYYCELCGDKICYQTALYGQHKCHKCGKKGKHYNVYRFGKNAPNFIDGRSSKIYYCIEKGCNNIISYTTWKYREGYCASCATKGNKHPFFGKKRPKHSKRMSGKNHPMFGRKSELHWNWQNGISFELYPLGWNKTFKEQIRYRDGYKCQICGCPEVENDRCLDIHHIDYNKENILPENLISLCKKCHMKTNTNRDYWYAYFMYITKQEIE